jgi:hypothetical protein
MEPVEQAGTGIDAQMQDWAHGTSPEDLSHKED